MCKNLAPTWSMLIKGVRSCQIYDELLDLYHLKNTKLFFREDLLKEKTLHENYMSVAKTFSSSKPTKLTKSHDMTRLTFSKRTRTFNLCQWTQTKTKVVLWQPITSIPVISRGLNTKKMYLWAKLYCTQAYQERGRR